MFNLRIKINLIYVIITGIFLFSSLTFGATGYGLSNIFSIDNRTGSGFRISSITPTYAGVFPEGVEVIDIITAQVNWSGKTPSKVVFSLNGNQKQVSTSGTQAQTTFNMGQDLTYSTSGAKNELQVWAVASDGSSSAIMFYNLWGLELPEWASYGPIEVVSQSGKIKMEGSAKLDALAIEATSKINDTIPGIGGTWGIEMEPLVFNWDLYAYPLGTTLGCTFNLDGSWGGSLKGGKNASGAISTSMSGSGGFNPEFNTTTL